MSDVDAWLAPYRKYSDQQVLVDTLDRLTSKGEPEDDVQAFFEDLMAPLEIENLSAKIFGAAFRNPEGEVPFSTSPQGVVDYCFNRIRKSGRVEPEDGGMLARAYAQMGLFEASEIATVFGYMNGDRSVETLALLAGMAIRQGRLDEAEQLAKEATELHPDAPEPGYYVGLCLIVRREISRAVQALVRVGRAHPQYLPIWHLLLDTCLQERLWLEAVKYGRAAVEAHPKDPLLWERLGAAFRGLGKTGEAAAAMHTALNLAAQDISLKGPERTRLVLRAAALEEEAGNWSAALARYQGLFESGVSEPGIFLQASECLKNLGRADDVEDLLRVGLSAHPDDPGLLTRLGGALCDAGRDTEAFRCLQKALELDPSRKENLFRMAVLSLRNERFDDALELASALLRDDGEPRAELLVLIGDAYRFKGAPDAALEAYREARRRAPQQEDIRRRIDELERKLGGRPKDRRGAADR